MWPAIHNGRWDRAICVQLFSSPRQTFPATFNPLPLAAVVQLAWQISAITCWVQCHRNTFFTRLLKTIDHIFSFSFVVVVLSSGQRFPFFIHVCNVFICIFVWVCFISFFLVLSFFCLGMNFCILDGHYWIPTCLSICPRLLSLNFRLNHCKKQQPKNKNKKKHLRPWFWYIVGLFFFQGSMQPTAWHRNWILQQSLCEVSQVPVVFSRQICTHPPPIRKGGHFGIYISKQSRSFLSTGITTIATFFCTVVRLWFDIVEIIMYTEQ